MDPPPLQPQMPSRVESTHFQRPMLRDESYAFFAQGEYHFTDQWSAILGLRWTRDSKHYAITDFWTFERDLAQPNPVWHLVAARSA